MSFVGHQSYISVFYISFALFIMNINFEPYRVSNYLDAIFVVAFFLEQQGVHSSWKNWRSIPEFDWKSWNSIGFSPVWLEKLEFYFF